MHACMSSYSYINYYIDNTEIDGQEVQKSYLVSRKFDGHYMYLLYCVYREDECDVDIIPKMVAIAIAKKCEKLIVAASMFYIGNGNQS